MQNDSAEVGSLFAAVGDVADTGRIAAAMAGSHDRARSEGGPGSNNFSEVAAAAVVAPLSFVYTSDSDFPPDAAPAASSLRALVPRY